jgi:phytoene dehydrogenase-like protein
MAKRYDAIVIGGGHNGLVCAAYLAKAGKKVLVLERRHVLGGAAVTEEIYPGFKYTVLSYVVSLFRPEIIRDLELVKYGLDIIPLDCAFTPLPDGNYLTRWGDRQKTYREISRFSRHDAEANWEFGRLMVQLAWFVKPILAMTPPDPASFNPRELFKLLGLARRLRGMGKDFPHFQAKLMTMSALGFLDMFFESDVLKAAMSVSGIIGTYLGIRSPGTAYVLLHHYMGELDGAYRSWGISRGGTGAVSEACAGAARHYGAEIRTEAPVAKILVKNGAAAGVALENGDELRANIVATSTDPKRTFLKFLEPGHVPADFLERIRKYKIRGSTAKVNLALDGLPSFTCLPGDGPHLRGDILAAPSTEYLERAYDDAKYGGFSRRPFLDVVIPSLMDPTVAPPGKHVMSIFVQYAPYDLKAGHWNDHREALGDTVVDTLSEYAPNLKDIILHRQVVTPWDMEQEFGLTGGNIFAGEITPDQIFMLRPVPGWARYRMPLKNLYMCGHGAHPGGGIMGAPGRLAVYAILKDS